jgi:hypothetical protein
MKVMNILFIALERYPGTEKVCAFVFLFRRNGNKNIEAKEVKLES